MGFEGVVEVNETGKLKASISAVFKASLAVPHIHQSADDPLRFPVGLETIDAGKLLTDTMLPANINESMIVSSFKFLAVIRISIIDLIRTLGNDSGHEKAGGTVPTNQRFKTLQYGLKRLAKGANHPGTSQT